MREFSGLKNLKLLKIFFPAPKSKIKRAVRRLCKSDLRNFCLIRELTKGKFSYQSEAIFLVEISQRMRRFSEDFFALYS